MNLRRSRPLRQLRAAFAVTALAALVAAPAANADGASVWADCGDDGRINQRHSQADYTDALSNPPADAAEYTDCGDQIRAAQLGAGSSGGAGAGGGTGGGGAAGGSAAPSVPPAALQEALTERGLDPTAPPPGPDAPAPPVQVGGESLNLSEGQLPSLAGALSLPLPLAASAIVVLFSAALPIIRYLTARFGPTPTGTISQP